ncbi:fatty acid desaturase [Nitzschia inconspicua]|uniref:Fatty acid desaturase n=1 Tax=Nitzschia inconspicua TaxID=303405 RepID=A0A9K3L3H9_9STRA|nr:fatty acid desaturase [Nitzschia inconspicua]
MWHHNALFWQLVCGAMMLHILAFGDAFHHTYEAVFPQNYTPGPGNRTAQYEEENTYSNLISISFPRLNLLNLNFGYHNAHHKRPMVPWYRLPSYHDKLYPTSNVIRSKVEGSADSHITLAEYACPQILSLKDIFASWHRHRLRRVLEEDYGEVHPLEAIDRARDFVGTLGASFLTVQQARIDILTWKFMGL